MFIDSRLRGNDGLALREGGTDGKSPLLPPPLMADIARPAALAHCGAADAVFAVFSFVAIAASVPAGHGQVARPFRQFKTQSA